MAETDENQFVPIRELRRQAWSRIDPLTRRHFLKYMGASFALAGLTGCTSNQPEKIVPYVKQPEDIVPGKPLFYATATTLGGIAIGVLGETHMGRPTKLEGNPDHPASLGATDTITQAQILQLYDPDRLRAVTSEGRIRNYTAFLTVLRGTVDAQRGKQGAGLRILTETITSPTIASQIEGILRAMPQARWIQYDPVGNDNAMAGARLALGQPVNTVYRFEQADVVLSLDADFLQCTPATLRYVRDYATRRQAGLEAMDMNRLYVVEAAMSDTGSNADHRLALPSREIDAFARAVATGLGVAAPAAPSGPPHGIPAGWIEELVKDLQAHRGRSIILVGESQPPFVHALGHALNAALGNVGQTVFYTDPLSPNAGGQVVALRQLVDDMGAGRVEALLIVGGNPAFNAPVDLNFGASLAGVGFRAHLTLEENETTQRCQWAVPMSHELEAWGDARGHDGTVTIMQPLIERLYDSRSPIEVLAAFGDQPDQSGHDIVRGFWQGRLQGGDFDLTWRNALNRGIVDNTALPTRTMAVQGNWATQPQPPQPAERVTEHEVVFKPDPFIYDGRFANNGWLMELPRPVTTLVWDNAALVNPATAKQLGVENEDTIDIRTRAGAVRAPVLVTHGVARGSIVVHLGFGRAKVGKVGTGAGFDAYRIRGTGGLWHTSDVTIYNAHRKYPLAVRQEVQSMLGREPVRHGTIQAYQKNKEHPEFVPEHTEHPYMYPLYDYSKINKWGMVINLNACIGCGACTMACNAENNIPVVGKEQVIKGRIMHWIRVDRYIEGSPDDPQIYTQPLPCMQCESAPCELVCPVEATAHSGEGLNDMVYNRCVGTR
ncbi:MAG: 4Fe-4S dicluster domain-containing protein, partial [Chloroflexi bacterium]|nr:4Fe-4S dicluster domain-containing protein [Chloroflexota bacterium]